MTNMENTITRRSLLKVAAATAGAAALGGTAPRTVTWDDLWAAGLE